MNGFGSLSGKSLVVASVATLGAVLSFQMLSRRFPAVVGKAMNMSTSSGKGTGVSFCFVTAPSKEVANKLADALVHEKLAACVNVIPGIQSTYLWEGKVERDEELLLMIKTRSSLTTQVAKFVEKNHGYDVPEVICTEVTDGLPAYLKWVAESTKTP
mmetsp:Transcript_708/g.1855  ORF Transcript_708/g.1855 Transcript_708/m.1855 type:complete len:157 (+) Transcript_708:60-530(+)